MMYFRLLPLLIPLHDGKISLSHFLTPPWENIKTQVWSLATLWRLSFEAFYFSLEGRFLSFISLLISISQVCHTLLIASVSRKIICWSLFGRCIILHGHHEKWGTTGSRNEIQQLHFKGTDTWVKEMFRGETNNLEQPSAERKLQAHWWDLAPGRPSGQCTGWVLRPLLSETSPERLLPWLVTWWVEEGCPAVSVRS